MLYGLSMWKDILILIWLIVIGSALYRLGKIYKGGLALLLLVNLLAVHLLAYARILNPLSLLILLLALPTLVYLRSRSWDLEGELSRLAKAVALFLAEIKMRGLWQSRPFLWLRARLSVRLPLALLSTPDGFLKITVVSVLLGITAYVRLRQPLMEVRYANLESYALLLSAQKLLVSDPVGFEGVLGSTVATLSLISSVDAVHALRFAGAICGILLVMTIALAIKTATRSPASWIVAAYALGAYLFNIAPLVKGRKEVWLQTLSGALVDSYPRQWAVGELEMALLLLLLVFRKTAQKQYLQATLYALLVLAFNPLLLVVAVPALLLLYLDRDWARYTALLLLAAGLTVPAQLYLRYGICHWGLLVLPVALALTVGALAELLGLLIRWAGWIGQGIVVTLFVALSTPLLPVGLEPKFLEYDVVARTTVEIAATRPRKRWTIVAPVEQLSQVYGRGWYEDLGNFVDYYGGMDEERMQAFPKAEIYVIVEKVPFKYFEREPVGVGFRLLTDPVYRRYRSVAGRAALEYKALEICEELRRRHGAEVYYEDEVVRVYKFGS